MYNRRMTTSYEIRLCDSCGLRYPLVQGHPHGIRCPVCLGSTRLILSRQLDLEPTRDRPRGLQREGTKPARKSLLEGEQKNTSIPSQQIDPLRARSEGSCSVLLDNIRSAWNVGSIFRSADGFGFLHAYLCGITPSPETEAVAKTSLGAEDSVAWSYHKDALKLVRGLKKQGFTILALEEDVRAVSIRNVDRNLKQKSRDTVLILGNEVTGVDPELLDLCDKILYIPMYGEKKSFNVAMAFSIAAFALTSD